MGDRKSSTCMYRAEIELYGALETRVAGTVVVLTTFTVTRCIVRRMEAIYSFSVTVLAFTEWGFMPAFGWGRCFLQLHHLLLKVE
jgi:hypothetical protein